MVAILPRAYGVPKTHKINAPLRIIIFSINSPLHNFAFFLHKTIYKSLTPLMSHVDNSFTITKIISRVKFEENFDLNSLDVISLFTNIPIELALQGIKNRQSVIKNNIPQEEFLNALKFIFFNTYFVFNNKFYRQVYGAPIGSPLSPILADVVIQDLGSHLLNSFNFKPPFYIKYVDDLALMAPRGQIREVLVSFNFYYPRLQFTLEHGVSVF